MTRLSVLLRSEVCQSAIVDIDTQPETIKEAKHSPHFGSYQNGCENRVKPAVSFDFPPKQYGAVLKRAKKKIRFYQHFKTSNGTIRELGVFAQKRKK